MYLVDFRQIFINGMGVQLTLFMISYYKQLRANFCGINESFTPWIQNSYICY